ncbi:quinon protein alcohol dehydrogenase-like superfamily [Suillus plorans]|uniref:Quinon protein alcohol dehydrogenase-like superfamily n=1 Tax=Suillus plorans TaxID=116603 RepID=A0A9P7ADW6_9AGAM|nr:quinon protein alcohol dehydrogenase-like superfamily [Suillus plorans]XP_041158356.1 quinon protein alcohol dehydrogenase-like superfamily [Suillus plorans]KAG1786305.1 quinon protein alcohol dehydrogenase-like superfamily [Suillus plorans]KAG1791550.1 quinon protein alcohol dehydrogenase-like superfamily [Suillus plorans]
MTEAEHPAIRITTPNKTLKGHEDGVLSVAAFPDRRRMVTASFDKTLRLWDLEDGVVLKIMEGHRFSVRKVAISRDGQLIASGDDGGELIAWNRHGESLTKPMKIHSNEVFSLDFSPDSTLLASGSFDATVELWNTKTWRVQGNPISCGNEIGGGAEIHCVRYSPSGEYLAIATNSNIEIWNLGKRNRIAKFLGHSAFDGSWNLSLAWMLDGTRARLFSTGSNRDPTIREWDTSTWKQVGEPWKGHSGPLNMIALNPTGTLLASASDDNQVRLWQLSDQQNIAIFKHTNEVYCVMFSADGKHILSGGGDSMISKWAVPSLEDIFGDQALDASVVHFTSLLHFILFKDALRLNQQVANNILAINTTARDACITGDLPTADRLLTKDIGVDSNDYNSYANRSFVKARNSDWDHALDDALKSISIQPSLMGCISKGIAHCGKQQLQDAMKAFDLAFLYVDTDLNKTRLLLLIKAIALFNANQHDEAILRVQELATTRPDPNSHACGIVEAYLHVQLGINALDDARHNEAADHFTTAVNTIDFSSMSAIHSGYDVFVVLFGWDLRSLWRTAHQNWCDALLRAGRLPEAIKAYRYTMDRADEATKARCIDWPTGKSSVLYATAGVTDLAAGGDDALAADDYDRAIELYSAAIDLDLATDTIFANRSKARSGKLLWDDALLDAEKVIELDPSSYSGYQLKHAVLHGAHRYDEAIEAFKIMLSKLENTPDTETRNLRQQHISLSEAERAIEESIKAQLDDAPHRLINTSTGRLHNREAQIDAFKMSTEYKELLSSTMKDVDLPLHRIQDVVAGYFQKVVYDLDPVGGIAKLQSFCKTARDKGYRWAWIDTCCIDQTNNVEVQQSVNSMFVWYRHSALTIIYLSDVPPSSQPGALASSAWNTRGWTVQEFLAPKFVLFYQKDWSLYLGDRSPNHKDPLQSCRDGRCDGNQCPSPRRLPSGDERRPEKLQWVSACHYVAGRYRILIVWYLRRQLPVIYGEKKQKRLGGSCRRL